MRRCAALLILCVALFAVTLSARQKRWFELYDEARQHVQRQEWSLAEAKLNDAKRLGPPPSRTALRYGSWRDDFFPDFYLGIVYFNSGRNELAVKQFELVRTQKLNVQDREFVTIADLEAKARTAISAAVTRPAPGPANTPTNTPTNTPNAATNAPTTPTTTPAGTAANAATSNPPPVSPPPQPINAAGPPANVNPPVDNRAQQFAQLLADAQTSIQQKRYTEAENTLQRAEALNVDRPRVEGLRRNAQLASAIDQAERALESRNVAVARSAIAAVQKSGGTSMLLADYAKRLRGIERLESVAVGERAAMVAFFKGDYAQTVSLLQDLEKGGAVSARGHFYRACALASIAMRREPADGAQLSEARRMFAVAAKDRAMIGTHRRFVSPKILLALGS